MMSFDPVILRQAANELKQERAQRAMRSRMRYGGLVASCPELAGLDAEISRSVLESVSAGPESQDSESHIELTEKRDELLIKLGCRPGEFIFSPACSRCGDRLYDGGAPCECLKKAYAALQTERLRQRLDVDRMSFDTFDPEVFSAEANPEYGLSPRENMSYICDRLIEFVRRFGKEEGNLFLNGAAGVGKTFLSACVAGEVSRKGYWTVYETAISLFAVMEANKFDRPDADLQEGRGYLACDLLIIDDLGTELLSPFVQTALYQIVNTRLSRRRRTIINSNLTLDDLRRRYAPQTMSRIEGEYELLFFFGDDLRLGKL